VEGDQRNMNSRKPRIAIIGAGSATFSAKIVVDLCITKELSGSHVVFMDIDEHRLDIIYKLACRLKKELNSDLSFSKTDNRAEALIDADFVINTAQIGGHNYAEAQRDLGTKHSYYRGNWLHYLRQMVFFQEVANDMEKICPQAYLIQSANPVFEGCTLLCRTSKIKTIGLCHGHYGIKRIARKIGLDPLKVDGHAVGFNHWIWLSQFNYDGNDAMPLLDRWISEHAKDDLSEEYDLGRASIEQYRLYGMMPVGDTARMAAWWMHTDFDTKQKWFGKVGGIDSHVGWKRHLENLQKQENLLEELCKDQTAKVCDVFKAEPSNEQIVPIMDSITNHNKGVYQVNIPNEGHIIKGIPEDVVVECQALIDGFGIHPISEKPFPKNLMIKAIVPRWSYAELMVEAVRHHDKQLLFHYMMGDHRTQNEKKAISFIEDWLNMEGNEYMKNYFNALIVTCVNR
jgi:alpha-galactosidase